MKMGIFATPRGSWPLAVRILLFFGDRNTRPNWYASSVFPSSFSESPSSPVCPPFFIYVFDTSISCLVSFGLLLTIATLIIPNQWTSLYIISEPCNLLRHSVAGLRTVEEERRSRETLISSLLAFQGTKPTSNCSHWITESAYRCLFPFLSSWLFNFLNWSKWYWVQSMHDLIVESKFGFGFSLFYDILLLVRPWWLLLPAIFFFLKKQSISLLSNLRSFKLSLFHVNLHFWKTNWGSWMNENGKGNWRPKEEKTIFRCVLL